MSKYQENSNFFRTNSKYRFCIELFWYIKKNDIQLTSLVLTLTSSSSRRCMEMNYIVGMSETCTYHPAAGHRPLSVLCADGLVGCRAAGVCGCLQLGRVVFVTPAQTAQLHATQPVRSVCDSVGGVSVPPARPVTQLRVIRRLFRPQGRRVQRAHSVRNRTALNGFAVSVYTDYIECNPVGFCVS